MRGNRLKFTLAGIEKYEKEMVVKTEVDDCNYKFKYIKRNPGIKPLK